MTQTKESACDRYQRLFRTAIASGSSSEGADHNAKRGRDLPFLHSFAAIYPQDSSEQFSLRQPGKKTSGIVAKHVIFLVSSRFLRNHLAKRSKEDPERSLRFKQEAV
ncbi:hypothetical protein ABU178_18720 [Pantoea osteomyelitidis]|uniref:Uncharacterized protein n=1 Tax=Pantoea osteomyelitidis TaxID=3230026 RepID=A0ABW7Q0S2_9GAMM